VFEDSQKIKVPDPSIAEDDGEAPSVKTADAPAETTGETLIEGAWADILGSGHLKKKVLYINNIILSFNMIFILNCSLTDPEKW